MSNHDSATDAPTPRSKPKIPLVIGMVAVGLALGTGTGAALVGPTLARKLGKVAEPPAAPADSSAPEEAPAKAGQAGEGTAPEVHLLENMVLNPAGSNGSRFLLFSVAIEVPNAAVAAKLKGRDAELRDIILTAIGTKPVEQLTDIAAREGFKTEIQRAIEERFGRKTVRSLYFPQFVVQ